MGRRRTDTSRDSEPTDALFRIKRGLAAYVSYLAACEMNQVFSEYVLYEPILRILTSRGYTVKCEHECPGIEQPGRGDRKRIDFHIRGHGVEMVLEVKWVKSKKPKINRDVEKLKAFATTQPKGLALLCVFGRKTHLERFAPSQIDSFRERGKAIYADFRKTRYGCRIFQLKKEKK